MTETASDTSIPESAESEHAAPEPDAPQAEATQDAAEASAAAQEPAAEPTLEIAAPGTGGAEYTVKLPTFEGPLDLLLHLIKVNELEITEISISQITTQYLDYLRLMERLDLEVAGEFIVMAATLLNIKLRSLLPAPEEEVTDEEAQELDDFVSARALMQRLIEYRRFKEAGQNLGRRFEHQSQVFVREVALPKLAEAEGDAEYRGDMEKLIEAFTRVLRFVDRKPFHSVQNEEFHVNDKITLIRRTLLMEPRVSMMEIFKGCRARLEMIVTLIAVLELCRLKEVAISQPDIYGDALIYRREKDPDLVDQSERNEALAREEREILANRTGLVDDGVIDDEDADDLDVDQLVQDLDSANAKLEAPAPESADEAATEPAPETEADEAAEPDASANSEAHEDAVESEAAGVAENVTEGDTAQDETAGEEAETSEDTARAELHEIHAEESDVTDEDEVGEDTLHEDALHADPEHEDALDLDDDVNMDEVADVAEVAEAADAINASLSDDEDFPEDTPEAPEDHEQPAEEEPEDMLEEMLGDASDGSESDGPSAEIVELNPSGTMPDLHDEAENESEPTDDPDRQ